MSETPHINSTTTQRGGGSPQTRPTEQTKPTQPSHSRNPHAQDSFRDVGIVAAILFGIVMVIGGVWMYQAHEDGKERRTSTTAASRHDAATKPATARSRPVVSPPVRPVSVSPAPARAPRHAPAGSMAFDVHFEPGSSKLSPAVKRVLNREAIRMKKQAGLAVLLRGHTDIRGTKASNQALGQKRALAVQEHLIEAGIPKTSIQVFSLGESGALCGVDSTACHRKNRRVHVEWKGSPGAQGDSTSRGVPAPTGPARVQGPAGTDSQKAEQGPQSLTAEAPAKS